MILLAALTCAALQVEAGGGDGPSTLLQVDLQTGATTTIATLEYRLNAVGYVASQDLVYGISSTGRIIGVDRRGTTTDLGKLPRWEMKHAVAGTISGDRFYVRSAGAIYTLDVNPSSPTYLDVLDMSWLWPIDFGVTVDDFDVNPADGLLYGISTHPWGHAEVVTLDPGNGKVRALHPSIDLPNGTGYGAAVFGRDGALYATNNNEHGRSVLYRITLDGTVTEVASREAVREIDAAGCLAEAPPATTPPSPSPPSPSPSPKPPVVVPPPVVITTTPPAGPAPVVVPPEITTTTTTTTVPPPSRKAQQIERPPEGVALEPSNRVRDLRRWSLTVLLLVLGAGALATRTATRRP
jgi:hypothetical protein